MTNDPSAGKPGVPMHCGQPVAGSGGMSMASWMTPVAVFVTLTASCMAAVAAGERGGTVVDKALLASMSIVVVLAVHLIPALSRRWMAWPVWIGCLLCAIYGHLTFLVHAGLQANDNRSQQSILAVDTERQINMVRDALARIHARPVATVAAELAEAHGRRERAALRMEIAEGRRAEALQDELAKLYGVSTAAHATGANDPVTARIAKVTGCSEQGVTIVIGMTFSVLIELVGALLWYEALRRPHGGYPSFRTSVPSDRKAEKHASAEAGQEEVIRDEAVTIGMTHATSAVSSQVTSVIHAIKVGQCRPTVAGIREFLGCSQARASELRRELMWMRAV